jgi:hypothetical protein
VAYRVEARLAWPLLHSKSSPAHQAREERTPRYAGPRCDAGVDLHATGGHEAGVVHPHGAPKLREALRAALAPRWGRGVNTAARREWPTFVPALSWRVGKRRITTINLATPERATDRGVGNRAGRSEPAKEARAGFFPVRENDV